AAAARNRAPREARDPAIQALRPGCEGLAEIDPAQVPVREARPRSLKPPRWSTERRAARVQGRKGAPQAPGLLRHLQAQRVPLHPDVSRRSATLDSGERSKDAKSARDSAAEICGVLDTRKLSPSSCEPGHDARRTRGLCSIPRRVRIQPADARND